MQMLRLHSAEANLNLVLEKKKLIFEHQQISRTVTQRLAPSVQTEAVWLLAVLLQPSP